MSLISHLYNGELGEWCVDRLIGWKAITTRIAEETSGREEVRPAGRVERRHWFQVERAFGIRMSALVQPAPPYTALHGLVRVGLVTRDWAHEQAALYPTHIHLPAAERGCALDLRPTVDGWLDLRADQEDLLLDDADADAGAGHREYPAEPMLTDLFDRVRAYLATHAPAGRLGPEKGLARVCLLLASFEYVYRNDKLVDPLFRLFADGVPTVEQLHDAPDGAAVDEMVALARHLDTSGSLARLRRLAGDPPVGTSLGIARPAFVGHWADGDLIVTGPDGATLLDVRTTSSIKTATRSRRWVWQLLAAAWLDAANNYRIDNVGLYFGRHGTLITWPVATLADILLDGGGQDRARREFCALAHRLRAQDHARRAEARAARQAALRVGSH